jgi:hypothetical protein
MQFDAGLFVKAGWFDVQAFGRHFAGQEFLRQWRALVRQERFIANENDLAIELVLAQARDDLPCGMSGTCYYYSLVHRFLLSPYTGTSGHRIGNSTMTVMKTTIVSGTPTLR